MRVYFGLFNVSCLFLSFLLITSGAKLFIAKSGLQYKIFGAQKKFKKWPSHLFIPKTNQTCHQKSNPFRETVPLKDYILLERGQVDRLAWAEH
jgi:hypothetical protein